MGANNHPTVVPEQMQSVEMPDDPLADWSDDVLKATFADMHRDHVVDKRGGWLTTVGLRAMQEELLDRGIAPTTVVDDYDMGDDAGASAAAAD